jgi:hypothetical protein
MFARAINVPFIVSAMVFLLCCQTHTEATDPMELDHTLLHDVYTTIFRLRDGSTLASIDSTAVEAMRGSLRRIVGVGGGVDSSNYNASGSRGDLLRLTRGLPDERLLGLLLLAVAGNFTVDQSPSALPQKCGIVVDPGTGALVLRDNAVAQSVILEVLLIVSIVCLLSAWGSPGKEAAK